MTLKELKEIIKGKRIDRIAGFCHSYEQMFDRCRLDVQSGSIEIDTRYNGDNGDQFEPVPKVIDQLLAMPSKYDDYPILKFGFDNVKCNKVLNRNVSSAKFLPSAEGNTGLCLLGHKPLRFIDDDDDDEFLYYECPYHVEFIIEDPRAQKLNEKFNEFIYANGNWPPHSKRIDEDSMYFSYNDEATLLSLVTDEGSSANLIALIAGTFDGTYFTRTPLTRATEVERLSNDRESKYFGPWQAVVYPAFVPDYYNVPHLREIAGSRCFVKECASKDEMKQFIASHNPNEAVGDLVRRITTSYIDDPIDLILE